MTTPKRQHYVPRFYLEYFTSQQGKFWVYDKVGDAPRQQTPNNTAVQNYFYSVQNASGEKDHSLEHVLSSLESIAKPILDLWQIRQTRPTAEEIGNIVHFVAAMHSRVPRNVDLMKQMLEAIYTEEIKKHAENEDQFHKSWNEFRVKHGNVHLSAEDALDFSRNIDKHFSIEMNEKAALAFSLQQATALPHFLEDMNWCLCEASDSQLFVTSDSPLVIFGPLEDGRATFGAGIGLPGAEVTFPLSPILCLQIDKYHTQKRRRVSREFVGEVNRRTAHMAERYVISQIKAKKVEALVQSAAWTYGHTKIDHEEIKERYKTKKER